MPNLISKSNSEEKMYSVLVDEGEYVFCMIEVTKAQGLLKLTFKGLSHNLNGENKFTEMDHSVPNIYIYDSSQKLP